MITYLTLLALVRSITVFESIWLDSYSCSGPPDIMYTFTVSDLLTNRAKNETWPAMYSLAINDYAYLNTCQYLNVPLVHDCCFSSLDLGQSLDQRSGMPHVLDSTVSNLHFNAPSSANQHNYVFFNGNTSNGSLHGYSNAYFLQSSSCINIGTYINQKPLAGSVIFMPNNTVNVYGESQCRGVFESITVTDRTFLWNSALLGQVDVSKIFTQNGTRTYDWIGYSPNVFVTPSLLVGLVFFGASAISIVYSMFLIFPKAYKSKNPVDFANAVFLSIRSVHLVISIIYLYLVTDDDQIAIMTILICMLTNVLSLIEIINSMHVILTYFDVSKTKKLLVYSCIWMARFGLAAGYYIAEGYELNNNFMQTWMDQYYIWMGIVFIQTVVNSTIIWSFSTGMSLKIFTHTQLWSLSDAIQRHKTFIFLIIVQIMACTLFGTLYLIQNRTILCGNDYCSMNMYPVLDFAYSSQSIATTFLTGLINDMITKKDL